MPEDKTKMDYDADLDTDTGNEDGSTLEIYLVIQMDDNDQGVRPLKNSDFASGISLHMQGQNLSVEVTNLGTRAVYTPIVEFCVFSDQTRIDSKNRKVLGIVQGPTIKSGETKTIVLSIPANAFNGMYTDFFQVQAYHPIFDGLQSPCNPLMDRHVGQFGYPLPGVWEGTSNEGDYKITISRPSSSQNYRVTVQYMNPGGYWDTYEATKILAGGKQLKFAIELPFLKPMHVLKPKDKTKPKLIKIEHDIFQQQKVIVAEWTISLIDNNSMSAEKDSKIEPYTVTKFSLQRKEMP